MPNRIIKESICTSEDINTLSPQEEVFFYRLIVNCDDFGRLDARIPILKSKLYPLKENMKSSDIERYLMKLSAIKPTPLIFLYNNSNIRYLQMVKWDKHQQIRAKRSKYPALTDEGSNLISDDINGNQMQAYVPVIQSNPNPIRESESESEKTSHFIPPSIEQVEEYCKERNNKVNPQNFIDHYTTNGWMRGKTKIKDWKACVRTWEHGEKESKSSNPFA